MKNCAQNRLLNIPVVQKEEVSQASFNILVDIIKKSSGISLGTYIYNFSFETIKNIG